MNRILLAGALLALAGCNTMRGLGKDLQQAGAVISGTADGVQHASAPARAPSQPTQPAQANDCRPDTNGLTPEGCAPAGFGKDLGAVGAAISDVAERAN